MLPFAIKRTREEQQAVGAEKPGGVIFEIRQGCR